ncbi:URC4/urg3 family protein [Azohydromonas lata]|uniref:URC4/urg3 family protein n=1 Tax=Azohydromonas lata TaxID=45677 RepID=A0ABU5IBC8_9BURK|nr:URC4/urg3 family protein [Azohydromonas lata]MDZ5456409.1 URC4/urg3 family protein [Azohydromonas lata]
MSNDLTPTLMPGDVSEGVRRLRQAATVRQRCAHITQGVREGRSEHFRLDEGRLDAVAQRIAALTQSRFPDGRIPLHSRWRHFEAGGVDRLAEVNARLAGHSHVARARAHIELVMISVLLDAGAGAQWQYVETESGQTFSRSEGLAVASLRAFLAGAFSSDPGDPCRVDAKALSRMDVPTLAALFQVRDINPLLGLEGRVNLLRRLAQALRAQPDTFTADGRPGHLFDALTHHHHAPRLHHHHVVPGSTQHQHHVAAPRLLQALLDGFSAIWPSGQQFLGVPVGDAWAHPLAGGEGPSAGWVPFHKLSQWLTWSLVEPFEAAGVHITELEALTGLPEYRNGGLLLDAGVIVPLDAEFGTRLRVPGEAWVIEWRSLTVSLLDALLPRVRALLANEHLPLGCLLEGGSWAAGRQIAAERRPGGAPPVAIDSDGTVF